MAYIILFFHNISKNVWHMDFSNISSFKAQSTNSISTKNGRPFLAQGKIRKKNLGHQAVNFIMPFLFCFSPSNSTFLQPFSHYNTRVLFDFHHPHISTLFLHPSFLIVLPDSNNLHKPGEHLLHCQRVENRCYAIK